MDFRLVKKKKLYLAIGLGVLSFGLLLNAFDNRNIFVHPVSSCTGGGSEIGGACWYMGAAGESCTTVCSSRGGYNSATGTFAGSSGSDVNCEAVLNALSAPAGAIGSAGNDGGCYFATSKSQRKRGTTSTTAGFSDAGMDRACACND